MKRVNVVILVVIGLSLVTSGWASDERVVALRGTGVGYADVVPDIDGDQLEDPATCFDLGLVDLKTDRVIGTATDCLSEITPVGDGIQLIGTTFFNFKEGLLVSRGLTTVQPVLHGSPDFTHITGAVPSPGDDSILMGTGRFQDATGSVRLSGAVDMSVAGQMTFDCLFVIRLEKPRGR